jgi:hypothetical protein
VIVLTRANVKILGKKHQWKEKMRANMLDFNELINNAITLNV